MQNKNKQLRRMKWINLCTRICPKLSRLSAGVNRSVMIGRLCHKRFASTSSRQSVFLHATVSGNILPIDLQRLHTTCAIRTIHIHKMIMSIMINICTKYNSFFFVVAAGNWLFSVKCHHLSLVQIWIHISLHCTREPHINNLYIFTSIPQSTM